MNRRRLLTSLSFFSSALVVPSVSGCLAADSDGEDGQPADENRDDMTDGAPNGEPDEVDRLVVEWERNDIPPYPIDRPDADDIQLTYDEYLGEHMPTEPSLGFEELPIDSTQVRDHSILPGPNSYVIILIENERERDDVIDLEEFGSEARERLETVDFDEEVLALVGDCCGSGDTEHRWARVEETATGIHLHGYLFKGDTDDWARRYSLLAIERPAEHLEQATASLTIRADTRVHFATNEGPVQLLPAVIGNDRAEELTADLRITTDTDEIRVDDAVTIGGEVHWQRIGLIGEVGSAFTVEVAVDAIDAATTEEYQENTPLGIRIRQDEMIDIGPERKLDQWKTFGPRFYARRNVFP